VKTRSVLTGHHEPEIFHQSLQHRGTVGQHVPAGRMETTGGGTQGDSWAAAPPSGDVNALQGTRARTRIVK